MRSWSPQRPRQRSGTNHRPEEQKKPRDSANRTSEIHQKKRHLNPILMPNLALLTRAAKPLSSDRQTCPGELHPKETPPPFWTFHVSGANRNKRNRIRTVPTKTTPSSSSPTDLERLDANVSSKDGLRKPLLTSSRHKCPLPKSSRYKRNNKRNC